MSIRLKVFVFIACVSLLSVLGLLAVQKAILDLHIRKIENDILTKQIAQVQGSLDEKVDRIDTLASDYAGWDDAYTFVVDRNIEFIESNLVNETFTAANLNIIVFFNSAGDIVFAKAFDLDDNITVFVPKDLNSVFGKDSPLIKLENTTENRKGIVVLDGKPLMFSTRPILTSQKEGPINGTVLMGQYIDSTIIEDLQLKNGSLPISMILKEHLDSARASIFDTVVSTTKSVIVPVSKDSIVGFEVISDVFDSPILLLQTESERNFYKEINRAVVYFILIVILIGAIAVLTATLFFDKTFLKPLHNLIKDVNSIKHHRNPNFQVRVRGKTELATLATYINEMLETIVSSKKETEESNRELEKHRHEIESIVKQRTDDLVKAHASLTAAIESFPDAFLLLNDKKRVIAHNSHIRALGIENTETLELSVVSNVFANSCDLFNLIDDCTEDGKPKEIKEIRVGDKIFNIYISPVKPHNSKLIIGAVLVISDVTEQKIHERAKDELINIISHELRTPLSVIKGYISIIEQKYSNDSKDEDFRRVISNLDSASKRLINLVNNVLTSSKLEQDKIVFDLKEIDICKTTKGILELYKGEFEKKNISLEVQPENTEILVLADEEKIKLVIENLVTNAIKYTENGSLTINYSMENEQAKVSFKDTGCGIETRNKTLLFRKLQQADDNILSRKNNQGSGLGLYVSKLLMGKMKGDIYLESSSKDLGSTFVFTLPYIKQ